MAAKKVKRVVVFLIALMVICADIYIVFNHLGVVEYMDFGAGAYYYADIPDFHKYVPNLNLANENSILIYWILFAGWGILMFFLWKCVDVLMCKYATRTDSK